jgi:hypothetical protein
MQVCVPPDRTSFIDDDALLPATMYVLSDAATTSMEQGKSKQYSSTTKTCCGERSCRVLTKWNRNACWAKKNTKQRSASKTNDGGGACVEAFHR